VTPAGRAPRAARDGGLIDTRDRSVSFLAAAPPRGERRSAGRAASAVAGGARSSRRNAWLALIVIAWLGAVLVTAPARSPAADLLAPSHVTSDHAVAWKSAPVMLPGAVVSAREELAGLPARTRDDSVRAWRALLQDSVMHGYALKRLAPLLLAAGDTSGADRTWAELAGVRSIWTYEALRGRADLALLAGSPARADSLLAGAERDDWPDLERASWLVRRAELRAMLADTAAATGFARQVVLRYPSLPPAPRALSDLELWMKMRGQQLAAEDERVAAEVEFFRPDRAAAAARLARAEPRLLPAARMRAALRRGEILRLDRSYLAAARALDAAARLAADSESRATVLLERARVFRDAGDRPRAFAAWDRAARLATAPETRETAWWEEMREAEEGDRWDLALAEAEKIARLGAKRAADASLRAGIYRLQDHDAAGALAAWRDVAGDGALFWSAVALRDSQRGVSDSLFTKLARAPGYGFYRMAARETLAATGWPGTIAAPATSPEPGIRLAAWLVALGAGDDAVRVLDRWALGDARLSDSKPSVPEPRWPQLLAAARVAYGAGRWATGIRYARAAFDAVPDSDRAARWAIAPWIVPPALDSLFAPHGDWQAPWPDSAAGAPGAAPEPAAPGLDARALPQTGAEPRADRPLIYAVCWQESKFDPRARSRSAALGLMQLKLSTAIEQGRWMHLRVASEGDLLDPALNVKLGVGYLERLLVRFQGRAAMALAAYNAGPTAAQRWARWPDPGGEAMACELIGYGQAHEYVQIILGVRQAVREMHPRCE